MVILVWVLGGDNSTSVLVIDYGSKFDSIMQKSSRSLVFIFNFHDFNIIFGPRDLNMYYFVYICFVKYLYQSHVKYKLYEIRLG